ncbi:MAG: hypothetical protein DMF53_17455 [Acidobacteria bacterium]|nr:MAG: hypothetical protein DMF53_17455 [Acidobacteriota bacterium]
MRRLPVLALLLILTAATAFAARQSVATSASFTPPAEPGVIYTVINFPRASGLAQSAVVNVDWGLASRRIVVAAPYRGACSTTTPSGFVLKLRHPRPDTTPLTITTTGTIVRGPYQGDVPLEVLNSCYKLVS